MYFLTIYDKSMHVVCSSDDGRTCPWVETNKHGILQPKGCLFIQGDPERTQHLRSLISKKAGIKSN